jgi:hypothetical protein
MKTLVILVLLGSPALASAETQSQTFQNAVNAYQAGRYSEAIPLFEGLLKGGLDSGQVHYDLASAYYRNQELGKALFHLRKALELLPRDPDVKFNLNYLRQKTVDLIDTRALVSPLTAKEGLFALALASILFWGLALVILFRRSEAGRWGVRVTLIFFLLALFGYVSGVGFQRRFGVVTSAQAEVYSSTGKDNILLFSLHEGAEFVAQNQISGWVQLSLPDGKRGWVKDGQVLVE